MPTEVQNQFDVHVLSASPRKSLPRWRLLAFLAVAVLYVVIPNARPDFTVFNATDSESYVALAKNLAAGRGYTRSLIPGMYVVHKTWPPALPLVFLPASMFGGDRINWLAVKETMVVLSLIGMLAAWFLVRRITGSERRADLAFALVALNPYYWDFSHQAMSEIPTIVWALGTLLLCDVVFAEKRPGYLMAASTGLVCGLGMLVRGTLIGLGAVSLLYCFGRRRMRHSFAVSASIAIVYSLAFCAAFVAWGVRNAPLHSNAFDDINQIRQLVEHSGTDRTLESPMEVLTRIAKNIKWYAIYRIPEQTIPFVADTALWKSSGSAVAAVCLSLLLLWLARPAVWSESYFGIDLLLAPMVALYLLFYSGGNSRYWVPVSILFLIQLVMRHSGAAWQRLSLSTRAACVCAAGVLVVLSFANYIVQHERRPFGAGKPWKELAELFTEIGDRPFETVGVLTPNPSAFQLMTGLPAPLLSTGYRPLFDVMIARLDGSGPQPPADATTLMGIGPWAAFRLRRPMTQTELLGHGDYAVGISVKGY